MSCIDKVACEQSAAAAELEHDTVASPNRFQQAEDALSATLRVEAEPTVVYQCEVGVVVASVSRIRSGHLKIALRQYRSSSIDSRMSARAR